MMCFQRVSALCRKAVTVRCTVVARSSGVCQLEPTSWRHRHTPVNECARSKQPLGSSSWLLGVKGTDTRAGCWSGMFQCVKPASRHAHGDLLSYRGGHERSAAAYMALLSPGARGLCSGNTEESKESSKVELKDRSGDSPVPGQGLFKFKELYENPWTIPNLLCVCRIVLAPFLGYLIIEQHFHLSLALFTLAGATDLCLCRECQRKGDLLWYCIKMDESWQKKTSLAKQQASSLDDPNLYQNVVFSVCSWSSVVVSCSEGDFENSHSNRLLLLDGYIARTWPTQKSALGSALDPLADKILISILYVSLTYAQLIPVLLTALVISRDIGLIAAVFWVRYKTVPSPVTLSKFFNPCYTTAQLKPTLFSKVNTAIQLLLVAASLAAPVFQYTDSIFLQCLWYVTAVTTTASGYSYWHYGRKTVQVLNTRSP